VRLGQTIATAFAAGAMALGCALLREGAALDPTLLEELVARTEAARELALPRPVDARVLAPGQVRRVLAREIALALEPGEIERTAEAGRALGLLAPDVDLGRALLDFGAEGLGGFYTPLWRRLYVVDLAGGPWRAIAGPGPRPRRLEAGVLVHELTHALQAVHSDLMDVTLGLQHDDDLAFALGALLEGDALWASFRDQELRDAAPPPAPAELARDMSAAWAEAEYPDVPRILRDPLVLQYPLGYALAVELAARGGSAALDAALRDPPLSSEQLLHPERWLDPAERDDPVFLELPEAPPAGCAPLLRNTFGELGLRVWLADRRGARSASESPAAGWDGDRMVVWRCPEGVAFAWWLRFDGPADAEEFAVVAEDALAGLEPGLAGAPRVATDGADVWIAAGLPDGELARLRAGGTARAHADLAALLAARPEVLARARALRTAVGR
jgi:hypothetical protein